MNLKSSSYVLLHVKLAAKWIVCVTCPASLSASDSFLCRLIFRPELRLTVNVALEIVHFKEIKKYYFCSIVVIMTVSHHPYFTGVFYRFEKKKHDGR